MLRGGRGRVMASQRRRWHQNTCAFSAVRTILAPRRRVLPPLPPGQPSLGVGVRDLVFSQSPVAHADQQDAQAVIADSRVELREFLLVLLHT